MEKNMKTSVYVHTTGSLLGVSITAGSVVTNPTSIHEDKGSIPGLAHQVKDLALLWLWCRLAATGLIRPLAWELPHAEGMAPKRLKKQNKTET